MPRGVGLDVAEAPRQHSPRYLEDAQHEEQARNASASRVFVRAGGRSLFPCEGMRRTSSLKPSHTAVRRVRDYAQEPALRHIAT
jgi:hypothetical protein